MRRFITGFGLLACSLGVYAQTPGVPLDAPAQGEAEGEAEDDPSLPQIQRRHYELSARANPYAISPHRPNYLLPASYSNRTHGQVFGVTDATLNHFEVKFQLSFKVAAWENVLSTQTDLYFAYTGRSFWQAYNSQVSSPFRDTNHEPELFLASHANWTLGPVRDLNLRLGFSHQSNGQPLPLSRSWNRVYVGANGRWRHFFVDLVLWQRLPEDPKTGPDDPEGDDNPGIEHTVGRGEMTVAWVVDDKTINLNWRNNLQRRNKGALTAAFTFPLNRRLKGYLEVFSGYGETLIDYNRSNERIGLGIALSDWP